MDKYLKSIITLLILTISFTAGSTGTTEEREDSIKQAEKRRKHMEYLKIKREKAREELPKYLEWLGRNYDIESECISEVPKGAADLGALPLLTKVIQYNPRPYNRVRAIEAIAVIEDYNEDIQALPVLKEALKDSAVEVRLETAKALVSLGIEVPIGILVLYDIAIGKNQENWILDWKRHRIITEKDIKEVEKEITKINTQIREIEEQIEETKTQVKRGEEKQVGKGSLKKKREKARGVRKLTPMSRLTILNYELKNLESKLDSLNKEYIKSPEKQKRVIHRIRGRAISEIGYLSIRKEKKRCVELIEKLRKNPEVKEKFGGVLERIRKRE